MSRGRDYTYEALSAAVASAHSWRGVLRALGHPGTSAGAQRSIRRQVAALDIDHSHFTGQRRWSDAQLLAAVPESRTWEDLLARLGLSSAGNQATIRAHAVRLGLDLSHLGRKMPAQPAAQPPPRLENLRVAGPTLAAGWFMLRGYEVLWPLEPCRYDLAVRSDTKFQRVQVKTASYRNAGTYVASLSNSRREGRGIYEVDEIDSFFVVDGELNAYLIPFEEVGGFQTIYLRNYRPYLVAERGHWLQAVATD